MPVTARRGLYTALSLCLLLIALCVHGQVDADTPAEAPADDEQVISVEVTARQWQELLQQAPGSISVVDQATLEAADIRTIADIAPLVPNLTLPDFTARWLSFPFIRGIGSGRNNPAVITVIDGAPQLSYATANQELTDVERIEALRGPQGSLYGRNALGGVIQIIPDLPTEEPSAYARLDAGSYDLLALRGGVSGPLGERGVRGSVSIGRSAREGFTTNQFTGHSLDDRSALFGRAQALWPENGSWTFRVSVGAERDRDGGYALGDLASLRAHPRRVAYDFEGCSDRDLAQPVFTATRHGASADLTSVTAWQWWEVYESSDIDASPADLLRRRTREDQQAWIQDLRLTSPTGADWALGDRAALRWLLGLFAFTADHGQETVTEYRPDAVQALGVPLPFEQRDTAGLGNSGLSPYGQGTLSLGTRVELTAGLRYDYEHKTALLRGATDPLLAPPTEMRAHRDFNQLSPHLSVAYHLTPDVLWYAGVFRGYKTGGFNAQAPADSIAYDEETSLSYETGVKTGWFGNLLVANLALFHTAWDDIQLDVPTGAPGIFYLDNAGNAVSRGGEMELTYRPARGMEVFGGVGTLATEFKSGSHSAGVDVSGNVLPFAPRLTWHTGARMSCALTPHTRGFAFVDLSRTGKYFYDAVNQAAEDGFTLLDLRLGVEQGPWRIEGWARNLLNANYVPVAFPFALAPSGYIGESGAPRTIGITVGARY